MVAAPRAPDQEQPEQLWIGAEEATSLLVRDPNHGSPEQRRLATLPAGHAQGYAQCFEAYVAGLELCNGFGELITAHIIEEPEMISSINPSVPGAFEAIVMKTLEKEPSARFQHMSEVEAEL